MNTLNMNTLYGLFTHGLPRFADRLAVIADGKSWTYAEVIDQANRLACELYDLGIRPGEPVALALSNRAEWLIADQAIIRLGAAKVPINDMLAGSEIEYILNDSAATVGFVDDVMFDRVVASDAPKLSRLIHLGTADRRDSDRFSGWDDVLAKRPAGIAAPSVAVEPTHLSMIAYTGGTTGRQKGVVHTQQTLATCELAHVVEIGLQDDERMLVISPLPHATGYMAQAGMLKGATIYIDRKFDPDSFLERVENDGITFVFMVPTMIYRVLDRMETRKADVSSLRTLLYGAAPITVERLRQGLGVFGPVFMQLYGQTESPDFITRLRREDHDPDHPERLTSCGQPAALVEVAIIDDDFNHLGTNEVGQVIARGPYVMREYNNMPERTAETLRDGWLHTGDLGRLDESGYLHLVDRKNDMIISGGMNVYSSEVENVIQTCDGVSQVAVVGVPDADWGERVVAFIVPEHAEVDLEPVRERCRQELAAYKRPKDLRLLEALPVTAFGKVDKKLLRAAFKDEGPPGS
jgi:fatty-acyl-CoA synthase